MTTERRHLNPLTGQDIGISLLLAACTLALYVRTLAPALLLGDSAEFQTLASTLGLAHPTGYPIYLLIGKLFTWLPVGSVAYRVNLLSACAAALALALLYLVGRRLGCRPSAALVGPLALAVCGLFWWHAVIAEVYALGAALIAGVLLLLMSWRHSGDWRALFAAGMLGGLSLGVHTTVALAAPAVLLYLLLTARRRAAWAAALTGAAAGLALLLLAFLSLDARDAQASFYNSTARPWLSRWGLYPGGFATPAQRLSFLISGREFQWAAHRVSLGDLQDHLIQYWRFLQAGWGLLAIGLMALGLLTTLLRRPGRAHPAWREALMLLLIWLSLLVFVVHYAVNDIYVFYIPTYVPLAAFASLGAAALIDGAAWLWARVAAGSNREASRRSREAATASPPRSLGASPQKPERAYDGGPVAQSIAALGRELIGAALVVATLWHTLPAVGDSVRAGRITFLDRTELARYPYPLLAPAAPERRAEQLVGQIEDDAVVFTDWGTVFTIYYVAHVEQGRTGIAAHEWFVQNDDPAANGSVIGYIDSELSRRPIYFTFVPDHLRPLYTFAPVGRGVQLFRVTGYQDALGSRKERARP